MKDYELFPNDKYSNDGCPKNERSAQPELVQSDSAPPDMGNFCDKADYLRALESWRRSEAYNIDDDDARILRLLSEAQYDKAAYDLLIALGYSVDKKGGGAR